MPESQFNCILVIVLTKIVQHSVSPDEPISFCASKTRQGKFKSNSLWRRWWGSWLPHTWRNHPTRSPHSCRPFDQVIQFFIISHWQFHIKFWGPFEIFVLVQVYWGYVFLRRNTIGILDTSARWFLKHPIIFSQPLYNRPSLVSLWNE